jgi:hypothetical protein
VDNDGDESDVDLDRNLEVWLNEPRLFFEVQGFWGINLDLPILGGIGRFWEVWFV